MKKDSLISRKEKFRHFLEEKLFLRFHMSLILLATAAAGLLAAKILYVCGVRQMIVRYPAAVIFAYIAFFGFVKLWLTFLFSSRAKKLRDTGGDIAGNIDIPNFSIGRSSAANLLRGGGGEFSGGGASSSFVEGLGPGTEQASSEVMAAAAPSSDTGLLDKAGDALSDIDGDAGKVLIVLGILLAVIFGAGIYLIYMAPVILSEAAFNLILAAGLKPGLKKINQPDWEGGVLRVTAPAFLLVMTVSLLAAYVCHRSYPQATKIGEVLRIIFRQLF